MGLYLLLNAYIIVDSLGFVTMLLNNSWDSWVKIVSFFKENKTKTKVYCGKSHLLPMSILLL